MFDEEVVDTIAEEMINNHLPNEIVPVLYVVDPASSMTNVSFVGMHLIDTAELLEIKARSKELVVTAKFTTEVDGIEYDVYVRSYEMWALLEDKQPWGNNEDLLMLAFMPAVHHELSYQWFTDTDIHLLVSKRLFHEEIQSFDLVYTPRVIGDNQDIGRQAFNKLVRLISYLTTKEYIWEDLEIDKFAAQTEISFNPMDPLSSIIKARTVFKKALEKSELSTCPSEWDVFMIDSKIKQIRLSLI